MSKREYFTEAERLYVEEGLPLADVAAALPVSESTLRRWRTEGEWDRKIRMHLAGPKSAAQLAEEILTAKLREFRDADPETLGSREIEEIERLVESVDRLKRRWNPFEVAVLAGGEFVRYVNSSVEDAGARRLIFDVWNDFVEEMREQNQDA